MPEKDEKSALLPKSNKVRRRSRNHSFTQSLYLDFSSLMSGSSDQRGRMLQKKVQSTRLGKHLKSI